MKRLVSKHPPRRYPVWTDEEKLCVRDLLLEGLNPKQIGITLDRPRNAICGMIHRTPFLKAAQEERVSKMPAGARFPFKKPALKIPLNIPKTTFVTPPTNLKPAVYDAQSLKIRLIDLKTYQCKYIPGDDHLSCGYPVHDGSVYCTHHMLRCKADRHVKGKERPIGWG